MFQLDSLILDLKVVSLLLKSIVMKKLIYTLIVLTAVTTTSYAKSAIQDRIKRAADYEYLHCKAKSADANQMITHFIVDIKNNSMNALYSQSGQAGLSATELSALRLLDNKLTDVNTDSQSDVSFVSVKNQMKFALIIQDTDGQLLDGKLTTSDSTLEIRCKDVTLK